ncbi:MAG: DDE-type integrase/transposase/recombinase [Anaerobutyricum sp.]
MGDSNNNALVFETFDKAVRQIQEPSYFHSDRGYQYTSRRFHQKLEEAGMVQSMSRGSTLYR